LFAVENNFPPSLVAVLLPARCVSCDWLVANVDKSVFLSSENKTMAEKYPGVLDAGWLVSCNHRVADCIFVHVLIILYSTQQAPLPKRQT